ncbi:MAG TPA: T9SS type A sorting domain-containing protein, partial [Chitinophagaceae bacterium]|nr:T9SS type A sorting domain-containing protein [Chitinophagaceae bacterium]
PIKKYHNAFLPNNALALIKDFSKTQSNGSHLTSAAAPHAAATAALIMQAKKKFLNQAITTPTEIRTLLQSTAVDMGTPGFDFSSGYGFINIDLALRTFAAPTPAINQLLIPVSSPITIPGESVFTLTVKGENFSNNSIIYFNDSALASTVVLNTNEATAVIPKFEGNPGIRIYTPPYPTTNGLDGGFSNTLYFFEADITVTAVNLTKKYGQQLPALDTIIKINGVLLQDTTLTLAGLGLSSLTLTTPATINSNVGTYIITPSRIFDENSPADVAFLQKYNYTFTSGTLTIEKLPLKVTPEDKTITYGQYIGNVTFKYEFDPAYPPANAAALTDTIKKYHNAFLPNNALALIKDFSKTQSNGSHLTAADLANMSIMATLKAVKNSRKFKLENNELVPTTNLNSINVQYLVDIASESIFDYKANPALAKFYNGYPGYSSKALLGETPLANNTAGIEITNGGLVSMINGSLAPMINTTSGASLVPLLNGGLVYLLNGSLATLVNGVPALIPNSPQIQLANGGLVYLLNGEYVPIVNGGLVSLLNGQSLPITSSNSYVELPNNYGVLHLTNSGELAQLLNGAEMPLVNASNVVQLTDGSFAYLVNGSLVSMINGTLVSLLNGGLASLVNGGLATLVNGGLASLVNTSEVTFTNGTLVSLLNSNSVGAGTVGNNTAVIIDETDVDLQTSNWLGNMFGINMITGLDVGQQSLIPGVLVNANFEIMYGLGTVTITPDPCLIAHSPDKNFGSSSNPGTATSLWLNLVTKISGQLKKKDDYLLFKSGTITFNNIVSTPLVTDFVIPTGKIIADNISVPFTKYDAASNTWITKVPVGFSSTSDIFITGAIINSSTGFVKNNNANTVVKGKFYSNLNNFKDQWAYASAAYQPQFTYASIADSGQVTTINGMYRAGTPTTQIAHLVNGGSGGGGNNYSGSTNSYDKFTACVLAGSPAVSRVNNLNQEEVQNILSEGQVQIIPNPATNYITLSFVPTHTGSSEIMLFTIDGKKIFETKNGICEAGIKYYKKIDVSKLISGVYIVQLRSTDKTAIKKIIISR